MKDDRKKWKTQRKKPDDTVESRGEKVPFFKSGGLGNSEKKDEGVVIVLNMLL